MQGARVSAELGISRTDHKGCLCFLINRDGATQRKVTPPDALSPQGGSCRYMGRFASEPTKAVMQLQLTGARQAECLSPMIKAVLVTLFQ